MDEIDELLSIRAAELYYEENKTQDEIGQALRLTRWKVGRLLAQAKQRGFIRIEILHPRARRLPIERRSSRWRARCWQGGAANSPNSSIARPLHLRHRAVPSCDSRCRPRRTPAYWTMRFHCSWRTVSAGSATTAVSMS